MHIDTKHIFETNVQDEEVKKHKKRLVRQLKNGFIQRSDQADKLVSHAKKSPYPVILCGDLNDLPYSYSYKRFQRYFKNAFEEKGQGFGFTLNKASLNFLRIDNHFLSDGIEVKSFETLNNVYHSDHFPILGSYSLKKFYD